MVLPMSHFICMFRSSEPCSRLKVCNVVLHCPHVKPGAARPDPPRSQSNTSWPYLVHWAEGTSDFFGFASGQR